MDPSLAVAWEGRITFDSCVALADRYHRRVVGTAGIELGELARELAEDIKQLDFLLKSTYVLHRQYWGLMRESGQSPEEFQLSQYTQFVLDLYATAFYYVAHRTQVILRHKQKPLPAIHRYREATGVREVRNWSLEHPKSEEFVSIAGTAGHSEHGPLVRASRDGKILNDESHWLFKDAAELEENIRDVLLRAHEVFDAGSPVSNVVNTRRRRG